MSIWAGHQPVPAVRQHAHHQVAILDGPGTDADRHINALPDHIHPAVGRLKMQRYPRIARHNRASIGPIWTCSKVTGQVILTLPRGSARSVSTASLRRLGLNQHRFAMLIKGLPDLGDRELTGGSAESNARPTAPRVAQCGG